MPDGSINPWVIAGNCFLCGDSGFAAVEKTARGSERAGALGTAVSGAEIFRNRVS
jgi:hypothetical protein